MSDEPRDQAPDDRAPDEPLLGDETADGPADGIVDDEPERDYVPGGRRRRRRSPIPGCLAVLVALAILGGGFYVGVTKGITWVSDRFDDAAAVDYPGPGKGSVEFEVEEGDTAAQIGRNLKEQDIVGSVDAFVEAAAADPDSAGIQVGVYQMKKQMSAADALEVLLDPANQLRTTVTIPEGLRVTEIVDTIAGGTDFKRGQLEKALQNPELGLPEYAGGNAEGYLFPATYDVTPETTPLSLLQQMVARWRQAADEANLEERAEALGKTPGELMIIASLVEAEGRGEDMPRIARVIYNRLDGPGDKGGTNGTLGIDASIAYGLGLSPGSTELTPEQLAEDTPYNTRINAGLPPTPIEAPGDDAIAAAANPAEGGWYYYVTVDLSTGETKFYEDYDGFLEGRAEYKAYCDTSDRC